MKSKLLSLLLSYILIITTTNASSFSSSSKFFPKVPRLSPIGRRSLLHRNFQISQATSIPPQYKVFYYNQTLDHFNYRPESYNSFQQRYYINFKYWGGANANAPIIAYLGAEGPIDDVVGYTGSLIESAPSFKALIVFIEHRYYGESIPYGSWMAVKNNASKLGYLNSAQSIADYAEILLHVKKTYKASKSPIIVMGGSYGGMLAAWFRLKYPHIALGALASSAPVLLFDDIVPSTAYYKVVSDNFKNTSYSCYQTIKQSWSEIDRVAAMPNGLSMLSNKFKTCRPLQQRSDLSNYLNSIFTNAAQYNSPATYPVRKICNGIDNNKNSDILDKIFSGISAYNPGAKCYVNSPNPNPIPPADSDSSDAWIWQTCSDIVFPIGVGNNEIYPAAPFNLADLINYCQYTFGISPRPNWATTYYGGHKIKLVLNKFGSNIIFTNGLTDPYSAGGVLEDINSSILALATVNGSHCLDLNPEDRATDPNWLVQQRQTSIRIVKNWIDQYNADLKYFKI